MDRSSLYAASDPPSRQRQTFPDEDLSVRPVVQDEAVVGDEGGLCEWVFISDQRDGHRTAAIRHLETR